MTTKYIGITIGPIVETILEAISPASMWFASTFFSQVTYTLCQKIEEQGGYIFSPYFNQKIDLSDGVGKYHDRILLTSDQLTGDDLDQMFDLVVTEMAEAFRASDSSEGDVIDVATTKRFLKEYLQLNYVVLEEQEVEGHNVCDLLNGYLDRLELMPTFPANNQNNPFRRLFLGKDGSRNLYIKRSRLFDSVRQKDRFLNANAQIKDLSEIAHQGLRLKTDHYFAVINSDGDNIGGLLKRLCEDGQGHLLPANQQVKQVHQFSKALLSYAQEAAELIHGAGGMTIYAGGDDLLFLAPVQGLNQQTVFSLCQNLKKLFDTKIVEHPSLKDYINPDEKPSLSFGVSVQYKKFPLYEALEESRNLLSVAKSFTGLGAKDRVKNALAFKLIKHSGQEISLVVHLSKIGELDDFLWSLNEEPSTLDTQLHSVIYTLGKLASSFSALNRWYLLNKPSKQEFLIRFNNFFDNAGQAGFSTYLERLSAFYSQQLLGNESWKFQLLDVPTNLSGSNQVAERQVLLFQQLLRLKKFLIEKGGER